MHRSKKTILVLLLFISPILVSAQIGSKKYVTKSKDTTTVVMVQSGLRSEASSFLRDQGIAEPDEDSRFNVLKDAANKTSTLSENVTTLERTINTAENNALEFERSRRNIERNKIEREIERLERKKLLFNDSSADEKAFLEEKFGDKPSYFINGIPADERIISYIQEKDILSRSLKVANTITGNPNGEIWYVVTNKALGKFGLLSEEREAEDEITPQATEKANHIRGTYFEYEEPGINTAGKSSSSNLSPKPKQQLTKQEKELEILKEQINVAREKQGLPPLSDLEFSNPTNKSSDTYNQPSQPKEKEVITTRLNMEGESIKRNEPTSNARDKDIEELRKEINELRIQRGLEPLPDRQVQTQTKEASKATSNTNNQKSQQQEIISFDDSPIEKAKQEEEPKRSVRKIKERERNK